MPRVGRLLGLAEQSLGEVFYGKHDIENAVLHLTEAVRILERVAEKPPVNAPSLVEAASACGSLGDVYAHGNGPADEAKAQALFEKQKALDERALALDPASERASRGIAVAGLKLAGMIEETQPADAAHLLESGLQRLATLQEASRRSMSNL